MYSIKDLFLFSGLNDSDVEEIISDFPPPKKFSKGDAVYSPDSFSHSLGVFIEGSGTAQSGDVMKRSFSEGDVFGAAAIFGTGEKYISEIRAKTACLILFIPEETLKGIFEKHPECAVNYITFLSDKIRFLNVKISHFTDKSAASRLYGFLRSNCDENGYVYTKSMTSLASLTHLSRTSLYRSVDELLQSGMIVKEKNYIRVI